MPIMIKHYTLNVWSRGKQFPEGPYIKCFVIYLDFPLNNHVVNTNKQRRRAGNNCTIVSRSGYIWIWSGACDQESSNHSACFVEWKSSYIKTSFIYLVIMTYRYLLLFNLWICTYIYFIFSFYLQLMWCLVDFINLINVDEHSQCEEWGPIILKKVSFCPNFTL